MRSLSLIALNEPNSMEAESYKMFRTNMSYMNIDKENKVILFTSSTSEEGKTTSICNTAVSFAQGGAKVLLIECDLRKAKVHEAFDLPQIPGVSDILSLKESLTKYVRTIEEVPNLHVLTSGVLPPDPVKMLMSHGMEALVEEARKLYDIVLIDAPPVLAVADGSVLCRLTDGVVMVVASAETRKEDARKAKGALEKVGANVLGVLLTKVAVTSKSHYYYYGKPAAKAKG